MYRACTEILPGPIDYILGRIESHSCLPPHFKNAKTSVCACVCRGVCARMCVYVRVREWKLTLSHCDQLYNVSTLCVNEDSITNHPDTSERKLFPKRLELIFVFLWFAFGYVAE